MYRGRPVRSMVSTLALAFRQVKRRRPPHGTGNVQAERGAGARRARGRQNRRQSDERPATAHRAPAPGDGYCKRDQDE